MLQGILLAGAGGFGGAACRYLAVYFITAFFGFMPYYAILAVNVAGSFAAGVFLAVPVNASIRTLCVTGFLGGFTTFSAFSADTLMLLKSGNTAAAFMNIILNVVLSLWAAAAGFIVTSFIVKS